MRLLLGAALAAAAAPAGAQTIALKPIAEARLRYETVHQDGLADTRSDALTARGRIGLSAAADGFTATVIGQGTVALDDHYYDGLHPPATRPLIADPENVALFVAQLQYRSKPLTVTVGRQRIGLDDERFVGLVNFRDNAQTFDAARFELTPVKNLKLDVTYAWSVRTIWGIDGTPARPQSIGGDNVFANLSYKTPLGVLTGFAYQVDQDQVGVQGYREESRSYGGRFAGAHPFSKQVRLAYQASYARQADYHRNPNDYRADYYLIDATLDAYGFKGGAGYEVLGAGKGRSAGAPFASFQTPLATLFKFNGWADKFLAATPPAGLRDLYGSVGYGWPKVGPASAVSLQAIYHDFRADRGDLRYGTEWDALAQAKFGRTSVSLRYADYRARGFATDTRKAWVQVDWAL